jgi:hypothetical protein
LGGCDHLFLVVLLACLGRGLGSGSRRGGRGACGLDLGLRLAGGPLAHLEDDSPIGCVRLDDA